MNKIQKAYNWEALPVDYSTPTHQLIINKNEAYLNFYDNQNYQIYLTFYLYKTDKNLFLQFKTLNETKWETIKLPVLSVVDFYNQFTNFLQSQLNIMLPEITEAEITFWIQSSYLACVNKELK